MGANIARDRPSKNDDLALNEFSSTAMMQQHRGIGRRPSKQGGGIPPVGEERNSSLRPQPPVISHNSRPPNLCEYRPSGFVGRPTTLSAISESNDSETTTSSSSSYSSMLTSDGESSADNSSTTSADTEKYGYEWKEVHVEYNDSDDDEEEDATVLTASSTSGSDQDHDATAASSSQSANKPKLSFKTVVRVLASLPRKKKGG